MRRFEPLVLAAAMALPTLTAWVYFIALSRPAELAPQASPLLQGAYAASKVVQFGLPLAWLKLADPATLRPRLAGTRGVGLGVVFGLATAALALGLYFGWLADLTLFRDTPTRIREKVAEFGAATPARFLALAAFIAVAHAALEEYYWRWFVYGRLRHHLPAVAAGVLSALAFMGHHILVLGVYFPGWFWAAVVPFSLCIAVGGAVWAWLYERSGSLLGPWLSHVIVDAALMAVGFDLLFHRV